jgi:PLP dependent protein
MTALGQRLGHVTERMARAAERAGREPSEALLVCVSKTRGVAEIEDAVAAGALALGENYAQEMLEKHSQLPGLSSVQWHFIGHLQRNKVRLLAPFCHLFHALDSLPLAEEIDRRAAQVGRRQAVLIEVNCGGEESKFGVQPPDAAGLAREVGRLAHVELQGLMTMAPLHPEAEHSRPFFRQLAALRQALVDDGIPGDSLRHLSMGMTQDFEVAIEEGATLVRVGTAIFGPRTV